MKPNPIKAIFQSRNIPFSMEDPVLHSLDEVCGISLDEECADARRLIVTNKTALFGAAVICSADLLDTIYKRIKCNFYIAPSSIHDVIISPEDTFAKASDLLEIVKQVNHTTVRKEEQLGDFVLFYNGKTKQMTIAAGEIFVPAPEI